jgi:CRISPR-associated protein Cmr4
MIKGYFLKNLTNMHVGSGDINFGVVDNLVQKDAITNYPVIHSSSLKGAFREHFESFEDNDMINYIFGQNPEDSSTKRPGAFAFFEAKLLFRPVRSSEELYFSATSKGILEEFLLMINNLGVEFSLKSEIETLLQQANENIIATKDVILEDEKAKKADFKLTDKFKQLFGENIAIYPDSLFKELSLPFIARNRLENGESKNLWYEEVVPRFSIFYFFIQKPDNINEKYLNQVQSFEEKFNNTKLIQLGANKSIGYGVCEIKEIQ